MKDLTYITALIIAITGLLGVIGGMIALMKRTRSIDVKVNGHLTHLLNILDKADIKLPSGALLRYSPPSHDGTDAETTNALEYFEHLKEEVGGDAGSSR